MPENSPVINTKGLDQSEFIVSLVFYVLFSLTSMQLGLISIKSISVKVSMLRARFINLKGFSKWLTVNSLCASSLLLINDSLPAL